MANCTEGMFSAEGNLFFSTAENECAYVQSKEGCTSFADRATVFGTDVTSVYADPLFLNAKEGDFTLSPSSPAFALGFKAIDTSDVGCTL